MTRPIVFFGLVTCGDITDSISKKSQRKGKLESTRNNTVVLNFRSCAEPKSYYWP